MSKNIAIVQDIYAGFVRNDIAAILNHLSENVVVINDDRDGAPLPAEMRCRRSGSGPGGALNFFANMERYFQTIHLEPAAFSEKGHQVLNTIQYDGIARNTGQNFSLSLNLVWSFNEAGLVSSWKLSGDFTALKNAYVTS